MPLAKATSDCTLSDVIKVASSSNANCLIIESISPKEACLISEARGLSPLKISPISLFAAISFILLISSNPRKPIAFPKFA